MTRCHNSEVVVDKRAENREKALRELQHLEVLLLDGHFDYGNGYHGRCYINPHALFRHPSTIWRFAQDLLDLLPTDLLQSAEIVVGPATGGALLAHTIAGLLDSRRALTHPASSFAPVHIDKDGFSIRPYYVQQIKGKRVLLADDVRNTGQTLATCAQLVKEAGGTVIGTMEIYDRLESTAEIGVPNFALAEYRAPENYKAAACPLCARKVPITRF